MKLLCLIRCRVDEVVIVGRFAEEWCARCRTVTVYTLAGPDPDAGEVREVWPHVEWMGS